jgi:NADH:ubiquinone reductase (H+-translocating)
VRALVTAARRPRVVIVGAGFAGLFAARGLRRAKVDVTLIDRHNYHLFQPLLYQVATAGLAPSDVAWPIRHVLSRQQNVTVLLDSVVGVDVAAAEIVTRERRLPYDYLVLATGARHDYFGHQDWAQHAPGLKSIDDATFMRRRILLAFEQAEMCDDPAERNRLLTFVIVGAGPTGVELAGTIAELARRTLSRDFRRIDSRSAHVILIEAGSRVLSSFSEASSTYAHRSLEALGVDVRLGHSVSACDADGVVASGSRVRSATVLWAAGVRASRAGQWVGAATDRAGRVLVGPELQVPGHEHIFVIGDTATLDDAAGRRVPGVAPAAKQQGRYVARRLQSIVGGRRPPGPFRYRDFGNFATIGRKSAIIESSGLRLRGLMAWWIWGIGHIYFLIGVHSPVVVALSWLRQYLTYGRGARLITGSLPEAADDTIAP